MLWRVEFGGVVLAATSGWEWVGPAATAAVGVVGMGGQVYLARRNANAGQELADKNAKSA
jgi:hypothetical protein